jgi:hypothetical protein
MTLPPFARGLAVAFSLALPHFRATSQPLDCGSPLTLQGKDGKSLRARQFSDGSIAVRAPLAVNPDGGAASYTVGDHGFTYIANGLARWRNGMRETCDAACSSAFKAAEADGFREGTEEFCVFAMEVAPVTAGQKLIDCQSGKVVGNGKGRPALGKVLTTLTDQPLQTYLSTTSLQHLVEGKPRQLDSEAIPMTVTPRADLLGHVVWVAGAGMTDTFALMGDVGPAFGEGSIALHQLLRTGAVTAQRPGPIPAAARCGAGELALKPPFESRPDGGKNDRCNAGSSSARTDSDVRAYAGLGVDLDFVVLGKAELVRKGSLVQTEVNRASIDAAARDKGYDSARLQQMLACLKP